MNNKADNNNASASAVALAPTGSNAGSDNLNPNPAVPPASASVFGDLTALHDAIRALQIAASAVEVPEITAAEKRRLLRIGKRAGFTKDSLQEALQTPGIVSRQFDLAEIGVHQADLAEFKGLITAIEHMLAHLKDGSSEKVRRS